ncbi:unnamed protein product, partial [Rotaria sordida]
LLRTNQTIGNNNKELETDSINQHQAREFILTNEQQPIGDEPMLAERIEDLQLKDPLHSILHHLDETRHYTSYFYTQTEFKDYKQSTMAPRAPILFNGKKFIS